jgi:hypothetical protein
LGCGNLGIIDGNVEIAEYLSKSPFLMFKWQRDRAGYQKEILKADLPTEMNPESHIFKAAG